MKSQCLPRNKPQIKVEDPHPQSHAALYRIKEYLQQKSFLGEYPFTLDFESYQGLEQFYSWKVTQVDKKKFWRVWGKFRAKFLKLKLKQHGTLTCWHCGESELIWDTINENPKVATVDHLVARSKGGNTFAENNLVVSCGPCNWNKSYRSVSEFRRTPYYQKKVLECGKA